jgi:acyl-coenzyme A synthetase/AMP-(fatty) acid ligase
LAMRRLLTMANIFENLADLYGDGEAIFTHDPMGYRHLPSRILTYRDCLHFTNLAAEAFIRDMDLKKGERVILYGLEPAEMLLVAIAIIKSGGIAVPLDAGLATHEIERRARLCHAGLAVLDARSLREQPDLPRCFPSPHRIAVSGPREKVAGGALSLDAAMDGSSGFFLPYTLKRGNVVGLFHAEMVDGSLKAVMATNHGLLGPQRVLAAMFPCRPGGLGVCSLTLESMAGFSAAVLALMAGSRLHLLPGGETRRALEAIEDEKACFFMGDSRLYPAISEELKAEYDLSSIHLWFAAGGYPPEGGARCLRGPGYKRTGSPALFMESYGACGNASMLALKPHLPFTAWPPEGYPGFTVPPNRMRVADAGGRRVGPGEEGELLIKGPAVTIGYWNDLEGSLRAKRGGWLHTGIRAKKTRFSLTIL